MKNRRFGAAVGCWQKTTSATEQSEMASILQFESHSGRDIGDVNDGEYPRGPLE